LAGLPEKRRYLPLRCWAQYFAFSQKGVVLFCVLKRWCKMTKKYRSDAFAAIHETMEALHDIGAVDKQTMREFDDACLTPVEVLSGDQILLLRQREHISQPVFARYLNVSRNLVSDWERGVKKPGGPALRLLTVIQKKGLAAIA
jgi:putative transcriptional regulator